MRAFSSVLLLTSPFLTHGLMARNGCSQILAKQSSWATGAQYRASINSVADPDWKMTLTFDSPLAAFEAADGIINTSDLQNIEIRPKSYLKSAPTGSGLDMLVKFRNGDESQLNAVSLNGYTFSCDTQVPGQESNSLAKYVPEGGVDVKFPAGKGKDEYVFDIEGKDMGPAECDLTDEFGCKNKQKGFKSKMYCKETEVDGKKEMKCSRVKITTVTHDSKCYPDQIITKDCEKLKIKDPDSCTSQDHIFKNCFSTCFC